jgi:SAM-dependent methyltransferase
MMGRNVSPPGPRDHPVRGRLNAVGWRLLERWMHARYGAWKERLFAELPGTVVELGPGSGANLRYLRPGTRLVGIEPNLHAHPVLRRAAARRGIDLELHAASAERIPLADASADAVVSTLVLCSVADRARVLAEVRRILRPGARFLCVEHVAAPPGSAVARVQHALDGPWGWLFDGCDPHADTVERLEAAGFASLRIERFTLSTIAIPVRPTIAAIAVR